MMLAQITATTATVWNGGICPSCSARYVGIHSCSVEDIDRRIDELVGLRARLFDRAADSGKPVDLNFDRTRTCPCRPENGGSGVCGCTLGGPQVTC